MFKFLKWLCKNKNQNLQDFSIQRIYSSESYKAQKMTVNKEKYANEQVLNYLLTCFPEIKSTYNKTKRDSKKYGKPLVFKTISGDSGGTDDFDLHSIELGVGEECTAAKARAVFIHELGEADYIIRCMPYVVYGIDERQDVKYITELFSHMHVNNFARKNRLWDYIKEQNEQEIDKFIRINYPQKYPDRWLCILHISHSIISVVGLKERCQYLQGYMENSHVVDQIVNIVENTKTMGNSIKVKQSMDRVIDLLIQNGMALENVQIVIRLKTKAAK